MAVEYANITGQIEKSPVGEFGKEESLKEAEMAAVIFRRARKRHPSYLPEPLYTEALSSIPSVSLETMALVVNNNGSLSFNMVERSFTDIVKQWRGKLYGRGVMIRNGEVDETGSIEKSWNRLIKDELKSGLITSPYDLCARPLDTGGRGKELAWIHVFQVEPNIPESEDVPLSMLSDRDIIPHHRKIVGWVLDELPKNIGRRQTDFLFKNSEGNPDLELSKEVAKELSFYKDKFPV